MLVKVAALNPVNYEYKNKIGFLLPEGIQHGFVAQELEKVFPELVQSVTKPLYDENGRPFGEEEFKSVNYIGLISVLTKSIQELNTKVDYLEEQLARNEESRLGVTQQSASRDNRQLEDSDYILMQNYPNPFESQSVISYKLTEYDNNASIMIFDMSGGFLKEYRLNNKEGEIIIRADDFSSGIYLYSLISSNKEIITRRMIIK